MRVWVWGAFSVVFLTVLSGCLDGGDSSGSSGEVVPDLNIECDVAQANHCGGSANNRTVYVGYIRALNVLCLNYLPGLTAAQMPSQFDAFGSTTVFQDGSALVGQVVNWVDSQNVALLRLREGRYRVCAFIDTNNNGQLDNMEPVGEGEVTLPSILTPSLNFWQQL